MINIDKKDNISPIEITLLITILYCSVYGIISIYLESLLLRSLKDLILVVLSLYCLFKIVFIKRSYYFIYGLLVLFAFFMLIGTINFLLVDREIYYWIYGMKITLLPISFLFVGYVFAKEVSIVFKKCLVYLYITLISVWVLQYFVGVDTLVSWGFVYGINVKHFIGGLPRLPSIVGSPDTYAVMLALLGFLLEKDPKITSKRYTKRIIKITTFVFLVLSTIRTAILFWLIAQVVSLIIESKLYLSKIIIRRISIILIIIPIIIIGALNIISTKTSILSSESLKERIAIWSSNNTRDDRIEILVGKGLGKVGAASKRLISIGRDGSNYSVDNQYLAIFEQTGLIGIILFLLFFIVILTRFISMINNSNDKEQKLTLLICVSLIAGILMSCLFTNMLEIFPFNILFWLYLGKNLHLIKNQ
ncbi:hypothetical protein J7E63_25110 [Bacillus sp. ISL-75]|uniref:O-antigen ligase family protein n=1 Tax=Bacillus sp. ISL-75 TaxID=2819137 RepID=UPI001BE841A1|nr:hypothetical protein [Bacillus sp. ISL-75]MBT2730139.1 hypothetical protein [Bacillus sp. ISL-75]